MHQFTERFISIYTPEFHKQTDQETHELDWCEKVGGTNLTALPGYHTRLGNRSLAAAIGATPMFGKILLYEGEYASWKLHHQGGVAVLDYNDQWYHNGKPVSASSVDSTTPSLSLRDHKKAYNEIHDMGNKIFIAEQLVFEGHFDEWGPNLKGGGIIIRNRKWFYLVVF